MTWPTPQDYNEAVQNPTTAFGDGELRSGLPELTALGLPRPSSGSFASVYRLHCGQQDWAVRCFLHNIPDQQQRYEKISEFVCNDSLPYTVGFRFLAEGIRVQGQWYPILKMEWVHGESLFSYIEKHLTDPETIDQLAEKFRIMIGELEIAGIAHGDLQHGNMLVVNHELRLVDYDGMFVPSLLGCHSNEIGHRNFQHPARGKQHFGPYLDNFSAWLIYLSLKFLALDWRLWDAMQGGDDCLLLRQADLVDPERSSRLAFLKAHDSEWIRSGSQFLQALLEIDPCYIQPLSSAYDTLSLQSVDKPSWLARAAWTATRWAQQHLRIRFPQQERPNQIGAVRQALATVRPVATTAVPTATAGSVGLPDWLKEAQKKHKVLPTEAPFQTRKPAGELATEAVRPQTSGSKKARKLLRDAKLAIQKGRFDGGINLIRNAQALVSRGDTRLQLELLQALAKAYIRKGEKLATEYKWDPAIAALEQGVNSLYQLRKCRGGLVEKPINMLLCETLQELAHCYERDGNLKETRHALESALAILKMYPQNDNRKWVLEQRIANLPG